MAHQPTSTLVTSHNLAHRITDAYGCRELVSDALEQHGIDPEHAWPLVLEALLSELSGWAVTVGLRVAGLTPEINEINPPANDDPPRRFNKTGVTGLQHRPQRNLPWRARCWKAGKCVFDRSYATRERAIDGRAKYLAGQG